MPETISSGTAEPAHQTSGEPEPQAEVNLNLLAERILELLKEEARLERERLAGRRSR
jgi:hypothetical protein